MILSTVFSPFCFFLFCLYCTNIESWKLITPNQWTILQKYAQNKEQLQPSMVEKYQLILYSRHVPLAKKTISNFCRFHKFKTKHVCMDDLEQYAFMGLMHAIKNYNGHYLFHSYAKIYIQGALYNGLTKHFPISKVSAKQRRKKKPFVKYTYETCGEMDTVKNSYLGKMDYIAHESQSEEIHQDLTRDLWIQIYQLPPFMRRIVYLKYDYHFTRIRSNEEIADYMGCSEETVRQQVHKFINFITCNNI